MVFAERGRDWHDLQHALTGYGRDGLGEVCVLTFLCAQGWNPGLLLIAVAGMFKVAKEIPGQPVKRAVWEAWRHGRKAAWLTGLDVIATRSLRDFLRQLKADGRCVLFSTHIMQEVAALCDRIVVIAAGRVVADGSPEALREQAGESSLEDAFVKIIGAAAVEGLA